jgi:hypothetical protein
MAHPRPLGRGMEQLSRAFLSEEGAAVEQPRVERRAQPRPESGGPLVLLPPAQLTRERIVAALRDFSGGLEEGLRILDEALPCPPCGEIEVVALDRMNRLAVVAVGSSAADELLVRGLAQVDWMVGNVPSLRRMFRGITINFSLHPRLFFLAPQFSQRMRSAARQIASPEIEWVRYHVLETPGGPGIFFERAPDE